MAVYQGLVDRDSFVRVSDPTLSLRVISGPAGEYIAVMFPEDVSVAYVQATNWFNGDRISLGPLTVWNIASEPNTLYFERQRRASGSQTRGSFSFLVDTDPDTDPGDDSLEYREG